jgi:hypothetical protein
MAKTIQCIACHKDLEDFSAAGGNWPIGGLAFWTSGRHYGTVIEVGTAIEINVCNECLEKAADAKRVLEFFPQTLRNEPQTELYKPWVYPKGRK